MNLSTVLGTEYSAYIVITECDERNKMVGWHHWLNGHEFEQAPGAGDGQGSLACAVHGVTKSQTQLTELNQ